MLLRFFEKAAKKDIQLTRTVLSLIRKLQDNPTFARQNKNRLVEKLRQHLMSDQVTRDATASAESRQAQQAQKQSKALGANMYNGGGGGGVRKHRDIQLERRRNPAYSGPATTRSVASAARRDQDYFAGIHDDDCTRTASYGDGLVRSADSKATVTIMRGSEKPRIVDKFGEYGVKEDGRHDGKCEDEHGVQERTTTEDTLPTHFVWSAKDEYIQDNIRRTLGELKGGRIKVHRDARNPQ